MWEQQSLIPELEKIAEVCICDLSVCLRGEVVSLADAVIEKLRDFLAASGPAKPDAVIFYARSPLLSEEAFSLLRLHSACPLIGMNLDDKTSFLPYAQFSDQNDNYGHWAPRFDVNLSSSRVVLDWYRQIGANAIFMAEGFHPDTEAQPPASGSVFQHPVSFVGSRKHEREPIIRAVQKRGIPIALFGNGWPDSQWVESANRVFAASQINLGIGLATPSLTALKARDFECPGAGGCYLTTWNWEFPELFEVGREILCYRNAEELIEMLGYYLPRPEECIRIAQAGWQRCQRDHTWERRFREVFRTLGFQV